jgi:hypothetical protein
MISSHGILPTESTKQSLIRREVGGGGKPLQATVVVRCRAESPKIAYTPYI